MTQILQFKQYWDMQQYLSTGTQTHKTKFQPYRIRHTSKCHWNHWFHLNLEHIIYWYRLHIPSWRDCGCQQEPLDLLWRILTQPPALSSQISSFSGSGQLVTWNGEIWISNDRQTFTQNTPKKRNFLYLKNIHMQNVYSPTVSLL